MPRRAIVAADIVVLDEITDNSRTSPYHAEVVLAAVRETQDCL
jgi:hypothetical protein